MTLNSLTTDKPVALRFQIELEFGNAGFCGGRKTGEPGKNPRSKDENQQQTQPTYGTRVWESNPGHIGKKRALTSVPSPFSAMVLTVVIKTKRHELMDEVKNDKFKLR